MKELTKLKEGEGKGGRGSGRVEGKEETETWRRG